MKWFWTKVFLDEFIFRIWMKVYLTPLECAGAQVCREAGARVTPNAFVRDLDVGAFSGFDGRRIEVIVDGLTLWQGAQLE